MAVADAAALGEHGPAIMLQEELGREAGKPQGKYEMTPRSTSLSPPFGERQMGKQPQKAISNQDGQTQQIDLFKKELVGFFKKIVNLKIDKLRKPTGNYMGSIFLAANFLQPTQLECNSQSYTTHFFNPFYQFSFR